MSKIRSRSPGPGGAPLSGVFFGDYAFAVVLAVGMSAGTILPLLAEIPLLSRTSASYEFFLAKHSFEAKHFLTFLYPEAVGTVLDGSGHELWEDVAYFGLVPLVLAAFGVILAWRRRGTAFFAGAFAISIMLAVDSPLLRFLFEFFPGFQLFRSPNRFLFLTAVFGIALAGVGLEGTRANAGVR